MENVDKLKTLQTIYAGALADTVKRLGENGILEQVTQQKRAEQLLAGKIRAEQMGMTTPEEVFIKLSDLMNCADWVITQEKDGDGFAATASRCLLCAMAKKIGAQSPCHIYCLDPMEGMVKGLDENVVFDAQSTLYDKNNCRIIVRPV